VLDFVNASEYRTRRIYRWLSVALLVASCSLAHAQKSDVPADAIKLKAGQQAFIEFTVDGNRLINPQVSPEPVPRKPVLIVVFERTGQERSMQILNGFERTLSYKLMVSFKGRRGYFELPMKAIAGGVQSRTTWGDPVEEIYLFDFQLSD